MKDTPVLNSKLTIADKRKNHFQAFTYTEDDGLKSTDSGNGTPKEIVDVYDEE